VITHVDRRIGMTVDSTTRIGFSRSTPASLSRPFATIRSAPAALSLVVALSTVLRTIGALAHPIPTLFPDEYIYAALGRSLGSSGLPLIRGEPAHFPALLEPLAAAPIWTLAPTMLAYHLVQVENAVFMSLAAIPLYLLARRLAFGTRYSLACATFAVAIPDLAYAGRTLAGAIAYPLVLSALYAAQVALERPTRRNQAAFLAFAALATLARVEYVVLVAAYFGALIATRRRGALKTHRLSLGLLLAAGGAATALGPARTLGYYSVVVDLHAGLTTLHWMGIDLFLLTVACGVVLVPGALVGLATARGQRDASFAALTIFQTIGLLVAAGLYASNGSERFQERYLYTLLPLVPLAFGIYLRNGRPARLAVIALGALFVVVSARTPLSGFAVSTGSTDSPLLWAVVRLNSLVGVATSSLLVAIYTGAATVVAVLIAFGLRVRTAFAGSLAFLAAASLAATAADVHATRLTRAEFASPNPTWVDDAHLGDVTAVATDLAPTGLLTEQLFWNRRITREVLLDGAEPTDAFATSDVRIAHDGTLETPSGPIRTPVLFERYGTTATFQKARLVASTASFELWHPKTDARLSMLQTGRYEDGWLASGGYLAFWPADGKRLRGTITFTVSLPAAFKPIHLTFGDRSATVRPGTATQFSYCVDTAREWKVLFHAGRTFLPDLREVSVRETTPQFTRGGSCNAPAKS
jgi:hypothetical protein